MAVDVSLPMQKIDAHIHSFELSRWQRLLYPKIYTPEKLLQKYSEMGVSKGVLLPSAMSTKKLYGPFKNYTDWYEKVNEVGYQLAQKYPDLFYFFMNLDPRMGTNSPDHDFSPYLEHYKSLGAKGVGELTCDIYFDDPRTENMFAHCEKCDMPVLFHINPKLGLNYGLADDLGLPRLEKMLQKFPKLKFIGHSQPFWAEITTDLEEKQRNGYPKGKVIPGKVVDMLRSYPNLYADLSAGSGLNAIRRDYEFGVKFLEEFQDQLFFGTDMTPRNFNPLDEFLLKTVHNGDVSEKTYEKIMGGNIRQYILS